jgi:FkbM family methyltransferase
MRNIYFFIYDINYFFKSFSKKRNYILFVPRLLSILIKKVLIFDKKRLSFFFQKIRNNYDLLTVYEIFQEEFYNLDNFEQSKFIKNYYEMILKNKKKPLIIDCGANIGSSSIYFRRIYKDSFIVSIEPELNNFSLLKNNFIDKNSEIINKAISCDGKNYFLNYSNDPRGFKIEKKSIFAQIESLTVDNILEKHNEKCLPFIIKIDIEGFEENLFSTNYNWLGNFPIIIIEIHDWLIPGKNNSKNFLKSLNQISGEHCNRDLIISGENLISIKTE